MYRRALTITVLLLATAPAAAHAGWSQPRLIAPGGAQSLAAALDGRRGGGVLFGNAGTGATGLVPLSGGAFGSATALDARPTRRLAIAPGGAALLVLSDEASSGLVVRVREPGADAFGPDVRLEATATHVDDLDAALLPGGAAAVAWVANRALHVATRPAGGSFASAETLSDTGEESSPAVALGERGDVVAGWLRGGRVEARIARPGKPFGAVQTLDRTRSRLPVDVAVDARGAATAAWTRTISGTGIELRYARAAPTGTFAASGRAARGRNVIAPQLAAAGDGTLMAWGELGGGFGFHAVVAERRRDGAFGDPQVVSLDNAFPVAVTRAPDGSAAVAWTFGASSALQIATREAGAPRFRFGRTLSPIGELTLGAFGHQFGIATAGRYALASWITQDGIRAALLTRGVKDASVGVDRTGPVLTVTKPSRARVLRDGRIVIAVTCSERCHVRTLGRPVGRGIGRRGWVRLERTLAAGRRTTLTYDIGDEGRAALAEALKGDRLVRAGVSIIAVNAYGTSTRSTVRTVLKQAG